jgi:hypothetical protein
MKSPARKLLEDMTALGITEGISVELVHAPAKNFLSNNGPNTLAIRVYGSIKEFKSGDMMRRAEAEAKKYFGKPKIYKTSNAQCGDDEWELYAAFMEWA